MGDINNLDLLSPNSDENEISLYFITTCANRQVIRLKEISPRISCLDIKTNSPYLFHKKSTAFLYHKLKCEPQKVPLVLDMIIPLT